MADGDNTTAWTIGKAVFAMAIIFVAAATLIHWSEDIFPPIWDWMASWLD